MRTICLQIAVALGLVAIAAFVWNHAGRDNLAAGSTEAVHREASDSNLIHSGRPPVVYIDPEGFLPEAVCRVVEKPLNDVSLREAAEAVGQIAGLPCRIAESDLKDEAADGGMLVTLTAGVPLYVALDQMCARQAHAESSRCRLDWYVEEGVVVITTEEAADSTYLSHGFDASRVVKSWNGDWQSIIDLLQTHSGDRCQWMDIDGVGGEIDVAANVLMVRQTYRQLRKAAAIFDAMQRRAELIRVDHSPADSRLFEALELPVNGWFHDVELQTAIASLSEQCHIPIAIAEEILLQNGVRTDDAVFCELRDQPLRVVLDAILQNVHGMELSYVIRDGMLWITTDAAHDDLLETVYYNVADILRVMHSQEVVDLVLSQVSGEWMDYDGFGGEVDIMPNEYLIVSATRAQHAELRNLLASVRESLVIPDAGDPGAVVSRTYHLSALLAEDFQKAVFYLVAPDSWDNSGRVGANGRGRIFAVRIDADHTSLIIHQTLDNHHEIERLLDRIDPYGYGHRRH